MTTVAADRLDDYEFAAKIGFNLEEKDQQDVMGISPTMIRKIFAVSCFGFLVNVSFAEETAHVVGPIQDGSPTAPAPPMPKLDIAPKDVLEATTRNLGNRKITIQKVVPIELPPLPEPVEPKKLTAEQRATLQARREQAKRNVMLMMAVTVFHSEGYPGKVRTKFQWWSEDRSKEFEAWSNVDGNWLSGFSNFDSGNTRYSLLLGAGNFDVDRWAAAMAQRGRTYTPPQVPELPQGDPAYIVTKGTPTVEELAPLVSMHSLVKTDGERLRLAFEGRQRAHQEQEAYLKTHPPQPKDIVLNYWRVEKPAAASSTPEGGSHE